LRERKRETKRSERLENEIDIVSFKGFKNNFRVDERMKFVTELTY